MSRTLSHVGLTVSDIARSTKFYEQLGFVRTFSAPVDDDTPLIKTITGFPDAHVEIQHLKLGDAVLELLRYVAPAGQNSGRHAHLQSGERSYSGQRRRRLC